MLLRHIFIYMLLRHIFIYMLLRHIFIYMLLRHFHIHVTETHFQQFSKTDLVLQIIVIYKKYTNKCKKLKVFVNIAI